MNLFIYAYTFCALFMLSYFILGGLIHLRDGANTQYVTGTAFLFGIYSDILTKNHQTVSCGNQVIQPTRLREFAKQQVISLLL